MQNQKLVTFLAKVNISKLVL